MGVGARSLRWLPGPGRLGENLVIYASLKGCTVSSVLPLPNTKVPRKGKALI